jgi:hypothetical protein
MLSPDPELLALMDAAAAGRPVGSHTHVSLDLELLEDDQEMGAMQASYKRKEETMDGVKKPLKSERERSPYTRNTPH